jgi:Flp pilus assembly protein TadD
LRTEPTKAQHLVEEIAVTRFEQGNWVGCIDALEDEALKDSAKSTELVRLRARCLLMMDRARDARDLMLTLRTQTDGDGRNASVLGLAAMRIGDTARMNDAGHVLTQARPDSADGWVLLGVAAMQNGDRAEAVRFLSEANKREPNKKLPKQLLAAASNVAIARATP